MRILLAAKETIAKYNYYNRLYPHRFTRLLDYYFPAHMHLL